ncbi:MAG: polysaccharide biosynthesis/export family protein [Bacteroidales bacterium]|nr:polysaccharide biosynthesis/export family protein [Bacteroidales bacterium]
MNARKILLSLAVVALVASCQSYKEMAYVQDAPRDTVTEINAQYIGGIQVNDLLSIYVESEEPSSTIQFNQETNKIAVTTTGTVMNPATGNTGKVPGYLVGGDGDIVFPVLGNLHVQGMSHSDLADMIAARLRDEGHINDAHVTVKLMNFKVSVLGDVAKPGEILVQGERLTIFEALSIVGDLQITGLRNNVTVVREENGKRVVGEIDLTSKEVFGSPYYYLHQNDVIYVEPNARKKKQATRDMTWMSYLSSAVSVVSLAFTSLYYLTLTQRYRNQ